MKYINKLLFGSLLVLSVGCDNDLDQYPTNVASSGSLTDFTEVLNAAYHYQQGANTSIAVMGDFRADNMKMGEAPYTDFDVFNSNLTTQEDQFFTPLYANMYKSILSSNSVIENSTDASQIGAAKFLRALSYFKLIQAFGDVSVNTSSSSTIADYDTMNRQPAMDVYNNVIIPDLQSAIASLDDSGISSRLASNLAAKALLGKVYVYMGDYSNAEGYLKTVIDQAGSAGVVLPTDFSEVILDSSTEVIFSTQRSTTIADEYGFSEFSDWYGGSEPKADLPLDADLTAAFDAAGDTTRKALTIDEALSKGVKYAEGLESDWIEIRLADVILLYAEALNENDNANGTQSAAVLSSLDAIRTRAGLASLSGTATTQDSVREAILDERRLELALEGHRWFDLVRTGTVDQEMGITINSNYYVFPVPTTEIAVLGGVISQNAGY